MTFKQDIDLDFCVEEKDKRKKFVVYLNEMEEQVIREAAIKLGLNFGPYIRSAAIAAALTQKSEK